MTAPTAAVDTETIVRIERATAHNLADYVAVLREVVPQHGYDCIPVAGGVAAFTGTGSPLTTVKGAGARLTATDLDEIESFFGDRGGTAVSIELAPWPGPESRALLVEHGYCVGSREDVVAMNVGRPRRTTAWASIAMPADPWCDLARQVIDDVPEAVTGPLLAAAARLPGSGLYGIGDDVGWIAAAQSVRYDDVVIFGNDATLPRARRRGAQTSLIEERLAALPPGTLASAEVAPGSGSERNYLRCGFRIMYARDQFVKTMS
jgi:hypothetical protein